MIDPRGEAVLITDKSTGLLSDRTRDVDRYDVGSDGTTHIAFRGGRRSYTYRPGNVRILRAPRPLPLDARMRIEVAGVCWSRVTAVLIFSDRDGEWWRVFRGDADHYTFPASLIRVVTSAEQERGAAEVLRYFREVVDGRPEDDPLRDPYRRLDFVHPESVLGTYLRATPVVERDPDTSLIFPFRCNLSQRTAVELGLRRSISVIEGPPGTGKTETILNLVANIVSARLGSVGVISYTNAAVENVGEKLDDLGFGHIVASLGNKEKTESFFAAQARRNAQVESTLRATGSAPPQPDRLIELDRRLRDLQCTERVRAERRGELDAYRLELRHFARHLEQDQVPDLEHLPLLRRSSGRILDYIVETGLEDDGSRPGLLRRIRRFFRYGALGNLDPQDTAVVLRLQRAYYDKRIAELQAEIDSAEETLRTADFDRLADEHQDLSGRALRTALDARYYGRTPETYTAQSYRRAPTFARFLDDYPVVLSTCHSLRRNLAGGYLLDYLVIDEASQVDLLTSVLALSSCRNVIVVGDLCQLPPISDNVRGSHHPPSPVYDCHGHSILSSMIALYGDRLPRTLLREHYRSDPRIIGFCNKAFYGGDLIPYTTRGTANPMTVVRTVEGNHMRQHRGGGRTNRRELDVIREEVIPRQCDGVDAADIGITTPYRRQADAVADALIADVQSDTVHKFQGRQKPVVIMTTVLDETWRGRTGLAFVDDPQKINVAVSRAVDRFILVTNNAMMPTSRHLRDLIGYIAYGNPGEEVVDSAVVSMFDLLYREYNDRLRPLAARLRNEMAYRSEDIIWTALRDILAEKQYAHLDVVNQVLLRNLLPDLERLTDRQVAFVRRRASVDFVVYNRVTNRPQVAVEVDGFAFHENNPAQLARDDLKDEIADVYGLRLLRLKTTGSLEEQRIRQALDATDL
ncbi:AAA domain-containing protein [Pseudonocardia endophytica]|uniref:Uncharacterized protein DUF2726 n=1 Tax=Pseudonocardia endophytica TaxID=401976 RepID=A0A4R1HXY3_PSEEN|nr:AAA domain-containing protein [Pseudonocardia endophytica]TCK26393.1 uncharacterized protein DUF2726 [Pseudonocardia endophytica]